MNTNKNNRNKELQERYGHLLDKYINAVDYQNPILHRGTSKYSKDVENGRYGHLLDHVSDPLQKMYDSMIRIQVNMFEQRKRKNEEEERAKLIAKGRIQVKKINEKRHTDRMQSFADGLIERQNTRIEAEMAQRAEEERKKREEQERIERFRHYTDSLNKAREMTTRVKELMEREQKREEEHNRQMAWFDSQKRE